MAKVIQLAAGNPRLVVARVSPIAGLKHTPPSLCFPSKTTLPRLAISNSCVRLSSMDSTSARLCRFDSDGPLRESETEKKDDFEEFCNVIMKSVREIVKPAVFVAVVLVLMICGRRNSALALTGGVMGGGFSNSSSDSSSYSSSSCSSSSSDSSPYSYSSSSDDSSHSSSSPSSSSSSSDSSPYSYPSPSYYSYSSSDDSYSSSSDSSPYSSSSGSSPRSSSSSSSSSSSPRASSSGSSPRSSSSSGFSSRSSSSGSSPRYSSSSFDSSHSPLRFAIIACFFLYICIVLYFLTIKRTIFKLQVAAVDTGRVIQDDLNRIAEKADSSTRDGLHFILKETLNSLLHHFEDCVAANSYEYFDHDGKNYQNVFTSLSSEERKKFDEETLVNVDGKKTESTLINQTNGSSSNEYIVVTILIAAYGPLVLPTVDTRKKLMTALKELQETPFSSIETLQVLWAPQAENDPLLEEELARKYPSLNRFWKNR